MSHTHLPRLLHGNSESDRDKHDRDHHLHDDAHAQLHERIRIKDVEVGIVREIH